MITALLGMLLKMRRCPFTHCFPSTVVQSGDAKTIKSGQILRFIVKIKASFRDYFITVFLQAIVNTTFKFRRVKVV